MILRAWFWGVWNILQKLFIYSLDCRTLNYYARKIWIFYIFNMFTVMVFTRIYVMAAYCFNLTLLYYIYMQLPCVHYKHAVFMRICLFWLWGSTTHIIIRFVIPVVFINKLDWSVCTCLTQLFDGRYMYRIYYIKNNSSYFYSVLY